MYDDRGSSRVLCNVLTFAFVGIPNGAPGPRPIEMERFAPVAVPSRGIVFAVAHQSFSGTGRHALGRVTIALAAAAYRQVGNRVMVRAARRRSRLQGGDGGPDGRLLGFVSL